MTNERPAFPEQARRTCPKCDSARFEPIPANNPGSEQGWFKCNACPHLWSQRLDRTAQGDHCQPLSSDRPEGEGQGA